MSAFSLSNLKYASRKERQIIDGFIRECQSLFHIQDNPSRIIPASINALCLAYYMNMEYFAVYDHTKIRVDHAGTTMVNKDDASVTVYGNVEVEKDEDVDYIYCWTLQIVQSSVGIYIGLCASNRKYIDTDFSIKSMSQYPFYVNIGNAVYSDVDEDENDYGVTDNGGFQAGTQVKMELNTRDETIKFYYDGEDQGIAFRKVRLDGITYHLALCVSFKAECVRLCNFERTTLLDSTS